METSVPTPGGAIAKRKLNFFWICDSSGSMEHSKIETLNRAIREAVPTVIEALKTHPEVQVMMRAIRFGDEASWQVGPEPVPIENFHLSWRDLSVTGHTATAKAIRLLSSELAVEKMPRRGLPPICILISDGYTTDTLEEYDAAIAALCASPWGKKAVRLAIGIGEDFSADELMKFVSHREVGILKARSADELVKWIVWASVTATISASRGKSRVDASAQRDVAVQMTLPPAMPTIASAGTVF